MNVLQHESGYLSDTEIVEKIRKGEKAFFEVLIRRYNSLLYKIARSYGFGHEDAEDLMQETHVAAFLHLKTFRAEASYKTWLTKIHLHHCYHKTNSKYSKHEDLPDDKFGSHGQEQQMPMTAQDAEKRIINRELGKLLQVSLGKIPLIYRNVFVLREIEGFNVTETAELLNITPVNVKVRLNRAKALLQKSLEAFYPAAELYEFHEVHCDKIVRRVFEQIATSEKI